MTDNVARMRAVRITPSIIFIAGCLALIAGVFMATTWRDLGLAPIIWALFGFGSIFVLAGIPKHAPFGSMRFLPLALGVVMLASAFGIVRVAAELDALEAQTVLALAGERVTLTGEVIDHPDIGLDKTRFTLLVESEEERGEVLGRALVTADRFAAPNFGDTVEVSGVVRIPEPFDGFDYPMFLAKDGITAIMRATEIEIIGGSFRYAQDYTTSYNPLSVARRGLGSIRRAVNESAVSILPYKEGAILKAVLIGDEGSMTDEFKEALNLSGLRHIVAVSGMNIAIILGLIGTAVSLLGGSRRSAFWIGFFGVVFFVLLIGAPASAVRASLMGLTLVLAPLLGRRGSGIRIAIATGAVMVAFSPLTLVYDVGFQLSFLAVLGIIILNPLISRPFRRLPKMLGVTISMTLAAQLAVVPLLLVVFGRVSLVAPLSNLVVVPAIAVVTIWGFAAVLAGVIFVPLGQLIALPLLPYFSLVAWVAETFARLPVAEYSIAGAAALLFATVWFSALIFIAVRAHKRMPWPIDLVPLYEGTHAQ